MSAPARVLVDMTHARAQHGMVGITRTVRSLFSALGRQGPAVAVAFAKGRFHHGDAGPPAAATQAGPAAWLAGAPVRRIARMLPLPIVEAGFRMAGALALSRPAGPPVAWQPGDWLLLADQSWNYPAWRAAAAARRCGARVVLVVYDLIPLLHPEFCEPLFTRVFARWLPRMLAECDAVACISQATAQDLRRWAAGQRLGLPPLTHFRLGSDAPRTAQGAPRPDVQAFFDAPGPVFSMVGSIEPRKAHAEVLDLFERLWDQGRTLRLFVAGRPHPLSQAIAQRLASHRRAGRELLFVDEAADADLALAYDRSRALLFPSRAEGFGLPVVEARNRGCPVIARALPCVRELADEGTRLFDTPQQLEACVREAEVSLRPAGGSPGALFGWDDSAMQLVARVAALSPRR